MNLSPETPFIVQHFPGIIGPGVKGLPIASLSAKIEDLEESFTQ